MMNTQQLIEELGGSSAVARMTGMTVSAISQWCARDSLPRPWSRYLRLKLKKKSEMWAQYDAYLAARDAPPQGEQNGEATQPGA